MSIKRILLLGAATAWLGTSCTVDTIPDTLGATPSGPGATIVFQPTAQPLPLIPLPNDVATFADPTSRTGRRINASIFAPTQMEQIARMGFDDMEGWGTYAPITVQFDKPPGADPSKPALDLDNIISRMQHDDYRFDNDPVYLVNLKTGVPMVLDVGDGNFPYTVRDPYRYWPNDPHVASDNLLFDPREEGKGLLPGNYTPALDTDFDGVLDHPNTWGPAKQWEGIDNLLTWYERETDTLIVRPLLPLEEKTEYAVVLTDRLTGSDGNPVKSPFAQVYHPQQRESVKVLESILSDASRKNYYGDIAGTGLRHVAFAWTFTTQPTIEDMILLRDGLYGKGPFARFKDEYPPKVTLLRAAGKVSGADQPADWTSDPICAERAKHPYTVYINDADIHQSFLTLYKEVFGYDPGDVKALDEANTNVDHVVIGTYQTPFLEGDPKGQDPDARFHLNFKTGEGDVRPDTASFMMVIPKATKQFHQPFPIALFGHGVGGNDTEALLYGGDYARNGVATVTINMPQHGLPDVNDTVLAKTELSQRCLVPWVDAIFTGRALDRNGDGFADPGWWWWTSHIANVRDNVRQGTLDEMQFTRILRTFDGKTMSGQDYNGDGKEDLAGDFDGDGVPDIGGPDVGIYASGESLGGIMSEVQGGIDHQLTGTMPMSGGGGLTDIGLRSYGVTESFNQLMGPLVIAIPASQRPPNKDGPRTNCTDTQMSVRMFAEDGDDVPEVELACLNADEDAANMTVVVTNIATGERHCAGTLADGGFRVPIGATYLDPLDIQIFNAPNAVDSWAKCDVLDSAPVGRDIRKFEQKASVYHTISGDSAPCPDTATEGCAQFMNRFFPVGSPLVAVQDGMGYARNTPQFRRFWNLAQAGVDPADPINFAPYYMLRTLPDPDGNPSPPRALIGVNTVGDGFVDIETGVAFARAAGAIPFLPPDDLGLYPEYADYVTPKALYDQYGGRTPNQVLIDDNVVEGVARLARHPAGPACGVNYDTSDPVTCPKTPVPDPTTCKNTLYDVDWVSEGRQKYDAQHPPVPLRLARIAGMHVDPNDPSSLERAWAPRLQGVPFSADATAWQATDKVLGVLNVYAEPGGKHTWDAPDACKLWDEATWGDNLMGRFFRSGGTDPYYLSHPSTHECLETLDCDYMLQQK